jgi:uncharacterized protein (TIGR02246 family)
MDAQVEAAIRANDEAFAAAFNRKDAQGIAALYTEDAAILPPGAPRADGRDAIAAFWQAVIDSGLTNASLTPVEVVVTGDTATEVGRAILHAPGTDGGPATPAHINFVVLWRRDAAGQWKLHRDIWNLTVA